MIAAVYARKSTDDSDRNEEARSTTRQIEHATAYAQAKGWTVDPRYIFTDDAVSGAEWKHRPGWNALIAALEPRPPFSVLIVSELSRIGRDTVRTPAAILQLEEAGVEIRSYLTDQPITLADESGEIMTVVHSLTASFERRRARQRTYDALRRRAEAGAVTGGRVYGYANQRNGDGYVHRVIDESEAVVVKRIFAMYAEGAGLTRIAKTLNAERIPSPRGGTGTWAGTAIRDMLRRQLYAGVIVWNKSQKVMRRGTKAQRWRPETEWLERPAPELAVVDRDLWNRVQERRTTAASTYLRRMNGRLIGRPSGADVESPYLLSGIAECGLCGGSLVAMTRSHGKQRVPFYGCLRFHKRGVQACRNGLQIRQDALDAAVVDVLVKALEPDVLAEAVRSAVAELLADHAAMLARRSIVTNELATIQTRERRLLDALVDGDADASAGAIRARLREELARRDALTAELAKLDAMPTLDTDAIMRDVEARAADLRGLLARHVAQARQVVRLLLEGRLVCQPFDDGHERGYTFTATGTYRRLGVPVVESVNVGGGPNGIRTRVSALRGPCPGPLDDGAGQTQRTQR
jgi:site-specific DNA recombinase